MSKSPKKKSEDIEEEEVLVPRTSVSIHVDDIYDIVAEEEESNSMTSHPFHTNLGSEAGPRSSKGSMKSRDSMSRGSHSTARGSLPVTQNQHQTPRSSTGTHSYSMKDGGKDEENTGEKDIDEDVDDENERFYGLCLAEKRLCCYYCKYTGFSFKDYNHYMIYCAVIWMFVCLFVAIIVPLILYSFIDQMIDDQVVIDSTSAPNYKMWQTNTHGDGFNKAKITMNMYFFDIINLHDVTYHAAIPELVEIGPYSYDEYYHKFDVQWLDDGDTVQYYTQKFYIFNQANSAPGLSDTDRIIMPYPTVVGFQYILDQIPPEVVPFYHDKVEAQLHQAEVKLEKDLTIFYNLIDRIDPDNTILPRPLRDHLLTEIATTNQSVVQFFDYVDTFLNQSNIGDLMFKQLMCNTSNGVSPFWRNTPAPSWFGWLRDPILLQISNLIAEIQSQANYNASVNGTLPWTSAVPGPTVNWTSESEVRRRKNPDVYKTGKKNRKQVGLYVNYQNMTEVYTCIHPARNQHQGEGFVEGEAFPACAHYQAEWTEEQAVNRGYVHPFNGTFANRVKGSDCTLFGRPLTSPKIQLFLSDIYRSAFAEHQEDVTWYHGIKLHRYGIQDKDVLNATMNPENTQFYSFGPQGLLNLTVADNLPVFVTFPHFYMADHRLVAAVKGLHPVKERHETIVDLEPQTGALVNVKKRLQVNYQLDSYSFPELSEQGVMFMNGICQNVTDILQTLIRIGLINATNLPIDYYDCNAILTTAPFFQCLTTPSKWKFHQDRIFFPYSWVDEYMELPESEAKSWNNSLFLADRIAAGIRFWGLVLAGGCFGVAVVMSYLEWLQFQRRKDKYASLCKEEEFGLENDPMIKPLLA